jgi:HSP20 family molecular chaperone IbpA
MSQLAKQEHSEATPAVERTRECPSYTPRFDILETDEELVLYGDLPGVEPADLDIRFENRELTVHGKVAPRHTERRHLYGEYGIGDFFRTFAIGETIDSGKISAELKNGVLSLHLPKTEAVKPKRIAVKAG